MARIEPSEQPKRSPLTEQQVADIRNDTRKQSEIVATYGVHQSTISKIKSGQRWVSTKQARKVAACG
jgi:hypothetical protein